MLRQFMAQMRIEQFFADGKYMVIYMDPKTILRDELSSLMMVRRD